MKNRMLFLLAIITCLTACQEKEATPPTFADTIYFNGTILTMEGNAPETVQAVAIKDDKILQIGTLEALETVANDSTVLIDLEENIMLPGFIEPHLHPLLATILIQTEIIAFNDWDLPHGQFAGVKDDESYWLSLDAAVAKDTNRTQPLITWGFHQLYHGEVTRAALDARYGNEPIVIWQYSFHEIIMNTAAMKLLQIDEAAAGQHHQVELEKGRFYEKGAQFFAAPKLMPYLLSPQQAAKGLQLTAQAIRNGGVTTIADMAMPLLNLDLELKLVKGVLDNPQVPFRTFLIPMASSFTKNSEGLEAAFTIIDSLEKHNTDKIKFVKHIKLMADGAFYSQLMQMAEPYTDGHQGEWLTEPEEFAKYAQFFWDKDYRIHVHANGDKGVEMVLNNLEKLQKANPKEDHRFTLHHLGYIRKDQVKRMARLGAQGSIQPYYLYSLGGKYAENGLGKKRATRISPVGYLIENDIVTCFHSDFFMAPVEPLTLMWVAVNRKTMGGRTFGAELRVSAWEALEAVTINAAHHLNQEDYIGSIKVGKKADFVILDKNPLTVNPEEIKDIEVIATVFEGRKF
ncbi:MAG: amidohydrolase [Saprospiraceae bacterium]